MPEPEDPTARTGAERKLRLVEKARLALLVLFDLLVVGLGLRRHRLPDLVRRLQRPARIRLPAVAPRRLGRIVHRLLSPGSYRPRCLVSSLVFLRALRRTGTAGELVIGLPPAAGSHDAHAWVEIDGREVGPPPGRLGHTEMARYGGPGRGGGRGGAGGTGRTVPG